MAKSIAFALERFSKYAGGAEAYALSLAETLNRRGWIVHLYGQEWDGYPSQAVFHRIVIPGWLPAWAKMLLFAFRHRQMVKKENIDVVFGFGNTIYMNVYQSHGGVHRYSTQRKCLSIRNPFVRSLKRFLIFFSIKDRVRNWIESAPFRQTPRPRIIAISQMVVDDIEAYFGFPAKDILLVYNGIDLQKFNPAAKACRREEARRQLHLAEKEIIFLFLSYTLRKKGIYPLLGAASILNEKYRGKFKVLVVGKELGRAIREKVSAYSLSDTVFFYGPTKEPMRYFASADVFVLPTYYDTCSLVTIEAMACGIPVITTEYNGAAGIINSGVDGYVVSHPPASEELARAMEVFFAEERLQEMKEKAAQKALGYSLASNHDAIVSVCEAVAAEAIS